MGPTRDDRLPPDRHLARVRELSGGDYRVPTMVFPDGDVLVEPGQASLLVRLGVTDRASKPFYDVIIVGGGLGGQVGLTQTLDDFPGFDEGIGCDEPAGRLNR